MKTYYFTQELHGDYWGQDTYRVEADSEEEALELLQQEKGELWDSWTDSCVNEYGDFEFDHEEDEED